MLPSLITLHHHLTPAACARRVGAARARWQATPTGAGGWVGSCQVGLQRGAQRAAELTEPLVHLLGAGLPGPRAGYGPTGRGAHSGTAAARWTGACLALVARGTAVALGCFLGAVWGAALALGSYFGAACQVVAGPQGAGTRAGARSPSSVDAPAASALAPEGDAWHLWLGMLQREAAKPRCSGQAEEPPVPALTALYSLIDRNASRVMLAKLLLQISACPRALESPFAAQLDALADRARAALEALGAAEATARR